MDAIELARGLAAGMAASLAMTAVEALAWLRWGMMAVFEWQEMQAVAAKVLGRRDLGTALALHVLFGGVAGIVFVLAVRVATLAPAVLYGTAYGFTMWVITLLIHRRVTGVAARGVGVAVSLVGHLLYGTLLGLWAV